MEYEIRDEPQGLPDRPEGERTGGLREDLIRFPGKSVDPRPDLSDRACRRDAPVRQSGEGNS